MTDEELAQATPAFRVVRGTPTPEELAAATVVVQAALAEAETQRYAPEPDAAPTAWQRSQRALRSPLHPGPGAWRSFG